MTPWRGASAAQPRRLLPPVRPGVGTDDAAPGADHARGRMSAAARDLARGRRSESPGGGTASSTRRATARRWRACCRGLSAGQPDMLTGFDAQRGAARRPLSYPAGGFGLQAHLILPVILNLRKHSLFTSAVGVAETIPSFSAEMIFTVASHLFGVPNRPISGSPGQFSFPSSQYFSAFTLKRFFAACRALASSSFVGSLHAV
jgi:hypothetical protein